MRAGDQDLRLISTVQSLEARERVERAALRGGFVACSESLPRACFLCEMRTVKLAHGAPPDSVGTSVVAQKSHRVSALRSNGLKPISVPHRLHNLKLFHLSKL